MPFKERDAQPGLQLVDLSADGGTRHVKLLAGGAERAGGGHRKKVA